MPHSKKNLHVLYLELEQAQHIPTAYFLTWRQGVKLAGVYYFGDGSDDGFDRADSIVKLLPNLQRIDTAFDSLRSPESLFLAAMTSLIDVYAGKELLDRAGFKGLADLCFLDLKRRQVLATLLLSYQER